MAAKPRSAPGVLSRRVLPFAPLTLALLLQNATLPTAGGRKSAPRAPAAAEMATCEDVETMEQCHTTYPTGCSLSDNPNYDAYLNLLKNQLTPRTAPVAGSFSSLADFEALDRRLPAGLKKGNHESFSKELAALGEGRSFTATGFLYYVTQTGAESVNCNLTSPDAVDLHIGIGFDPAVASELLALRKARRGIPTDLQRRLRTGSIIVEMTPHFRSTVGEQWSFDNVRAHVGEPVRVTGQLLVDNEHNVPSQNCALPGADTSKCWRGSAWELHPVTRFQVCASDSGCTASSGDWSDLESVPPKPASPS